MTSSNTIRRRRPMSRPAALVSLCGVTLLALSGCQHSDRRPNILLYVVDTMRADAVACYGDAQLQTPAMDRLAQEGIRFTQAYANASWTRASMGSLLTGLYPSAHGAVGRLDALRAGVPTLAATLRQGGYRTAAIVANPNIGSPFEFSEGFDEFIELYKPHTGDVRPEELIATAERVVDRAIAWLRSASGAPFFLLVFSIDPHAPYTPPPPYATLYDPEYTGTIDGSLRSLVALGAFGAAPPEREVRHLRALYHGEVTFNDAQLSRLMATVRERGLDANTVVVLTSDHGEEFYEHGGRDHGHTLYEELIHVPLIMRWTGTIPAGATASGPVQLVDVFPTLLRFAGVRAPRADAAPAPGRDLGDLVLGKATDGADPAIYAEEDLDQHRLRALRQGDHKLIEDLVTGQPFTFDLAKDVGERSPLPGFPPPDLVLAMQTVIRNQALNARPASRQVSATALPDSVRHALDALGYGDPAKPR